LQKNYTFSSISLRISFLIFGLIEHMFDFVMLIVLYPSEGLLVSKLKHWCCVSICCAVVLLFLILYVMLVSHAISSVLIF